MKDYSEHPYQRGYDMLNADELSLAMNDASLDDETKHEIWEGYCNAHLDRVMGILRRDIEALPIHVRGMVLLEIADLIEKWQRL